MKTPFKTLIALAVMFLVSSGIVKAQAQKFGYVDLQELMLLMPEYKKANADMEAYGKSLEDELKAMSEEFQKKLAEYQKNEKTMSEAIKDIRQKELQDIQNRIQQFQQDAQGLIRDKERELLKPVIDTAKANIALVAKEGGYSYIFDSSTAGFLYKPDGDNVMVQVKKKMKIQP